MSNWKDLLKSLISVSTVEELPAEVMRMRLFVPIRIFDTADMTNDVELVDLALDLLIILSSDPELCMQLSSGSTDVFVKNIFHLSLDASSPSNVKAQALINNLTVQECWCNRLLRIVSVDRLILTLDPAFGYTFNQSTDFFPQILLNLTQTKATRMKICDPNSNNLKNIIAFCESPSSSLKRKIAFSGLLKNLCFDEELHNILLSSETLDFLSTLLLPLCDSTHQLSVEENFQLPVMLQFVPGDKTTSRETDATVTCNLLESLFLLCSRPCGRRRLRDAGVQFILRELRKNEKLCRRVLLAIENLNPLICGETADCENLRDLRLVEVPEYIQHEVDRVKKDFLDLE